MDYYLVHAGFNLNHPQPLEDYISMLWLKDFQYIAGKIPHKRIIYGHKNYSIADIQLAIKNLAQIIPLDNGCYKGLKYEGDSLAEFGNLCAFNLDTRQLLIQPCID
jgi:serine/threonine protein phosphatase 1